MQPSLFTGLLPIRHHANLRPQGKAAPVYNDDVLDAADRGQRGRRVGSGAVYIPGARLLSHFMLALCFFCE